jgi:hypothetical protein
VPQPSSHKLRLPRDPDIFGGALAHIVLAKGDKDEVLGQAWIAAPNTLITCGHVVDQFVRSPGSLTVKFPASGNRYVIKEIKLHPSFQRHEGDLVKFDVAALIVDLIEPESTTRTLPVLYEKEVDTHTTLSAIRYPSHLGVYTTSLSPLAQIGSYLGPLKRNDRFHLLHDLALAPGDSGTALFDGESVVAIHCGDTATLPGLNLPTTSIRMALSVDALMALGVAETTETQSPGLGSLVPAVIAFILCGFLTLGVFAYQYKDQWSATPKPEYLVDVAFDHPTDQYKFHQELSMTLTPRANCFLYVYYVDKTMALQLYPPPLMKTEHGGAKSGQRIVIDSYGQHPIVVDPEEGGVFHIVALNTETPPVMANEQADENTYLLPVRPKVLLDRIAKLKDKNPAQILHQEIKAPISAAESKAPES